jgi:Predicted acetyltransferase
MSDQTAALTVRLGRPEDYEAVLDIQRRAYRAKEAPLYGEDIPPLSETPESLERESSDGKRLVVGLLDRKIVASLRMKALDDGSVYFGRLSVDPDHQGKGFGQIMAQAVEELNPAVFEFVLDCGEFSDENFHIYSKLGYVKTGKSFQVENGPKCVEMRKQKKS